MYHSLTLLAGCVLFFNSTSLPPVTFLVIAMSLALMAVRQRRFAVQYVCMAVLGYCWSGIYVHIFDPEPLPEQWIKRPLTIKACVLETKTYSDAFQRLLLDVENVDFPDHQVKFAGKVMLANYQANIHQLKPGLCGQFSVSLKPVHSTLNQYGFDYEAWAYVRNIAARGYLKSIDDLYPAASWYLKFLSARAELISQWKSLTLEHFSSGLSLALGFGDRSLIDDQIWQLLRRTGTGHLLAISGLHIGLVFWFASIGFTMLWRCSPTVCLRYPAQKAGWIAGIVLSAIFLVFVGVPLSGQRAWLMLLIAVACFVLERKASFIQALNLALLLILMIWPKSVLSAGFWFSFVAVAIILLVSLNVRGWLQPTNHLSANRVVSRLIELLRLQIVLSLIMLPLSVFYFGELSLISPLANLIAIPLVSFVILPLTLIAVMALIVGAKPVVKSLIDWVDTLLVELFEWLEFLLSFDGAWQAPQIHSQLSIILLLMGLVLWRYLRHWPGNWVLLCLLLPLLIDAKSAQRSAEFDLVVFDVGQGLAVMIKVADKHLLVDTGYGKKEGFSYFNAVIEPHLIAEGVDRLDRLIVSHADSDHAGGLFALTQSRFAPDLMYSSDKLLPGFSFCQGNADWDWHGVSFRFFIVPNISGANNRSCVLKISSRYGSVLLPGDIEALAEKQLLKLYRDELGATVLLAPHHGSKTSSTASFIRAVAPKLVVFTSGYLNRYNHPADDVVARYQRLAIQRFNTACHGQIIVNFRQTGWLVSFLRNESQPFWRHRCHKS